MNKDFYISLISKKLSNELNAAELKDLNIWLSDDKVNNLTLNQFKSTWDLTKDYKSDFSFDAGTAFQSFASKYEIPTTSNKTNIEPKSKVGVKKYILILSLLMITSAFIGALIYNSYFNTANPNQVANHEMHAQSFNLNDAVNITIAPNSRFDKGEYTIGRKDDKSASNSANASSNGSDVVNNSNKSNNFTAPNNNNNSNNNSTNNYNTSTNSNTDYAVENFYGQGYFDVNVEQGMKAAIIAVEDGNYIESENATFNLQNYEDDNFSVIDVQTGSVKFVAGDNVLIVEEGQRLIYDETTKNFEKVDLPKLSPFQWHKGILVFDNTPLSEAFPMIERFFGVDIEVIDQSNLDRPITFTHYKSGTLNDCLELVSETVDMSIIRKGNRNIEVSNIK